MISIVSYSQHDHPAKSEGGNSDQSNAAFKDPTIGKAYDQYALLKDALIASNATDAKKIASELQKSLASFPNGKEALEGATIIAATDNLKDQRKAFSELSNEMTKLVKGQLSSGSIYREYCPMANGGSYWLRR